MKSGEVVIRKAKKSDLTPAALVFKTESAKKPYYQSWTLKNAKIKLSKFLKEDFYVAIKNERVVGFITSILSSEGSYIDEFWISRKYQGKGIGRRLIEKTEFSAKKRKAKKIGVLVTPTANAFHAYTKFGYKVKTRLVYMHKFLK